MRYSQAFIPTLKENPADAEVASHRLMLRAGLIRPLVAGVYSYLPLGWLAMKKAEQIIREEIDGIGGQEFSLPTLSPKELWQETGRLDDFGELIFSLRDRKGRDLCLAPTHEEIITDIARLSIRSFRDMPQLWYQIQLKHRDEFRPRSGVLRGRMFIMKDSYSLDVDEEGLEATYQRHRKAYSRIFGRCGLDFVIVEASSGLMGGSRSEEYMAPTEAGEDTVIRCSHCGYAANMEVGRSVARPTEPLQKKGQEKVHTPGQRTIAEVSAFLGCRPEHLLKSMLFMVGEKPLLALVRGDHDVNEAKLAALLKTEFRPATPEEALRITGAHLGFIGPKGLKGVRIIADLAVQQAQSFVTGANEDDYHVVGLCPEKDFPVNQYEDLRHVLEGDLCFHCQHPLHIEPAIELGHIFKLGTKYSSALGATYLDTQGHSKPIVMGSYGIGLERIIAAAIEQHHDADGIIWPLAISPYQVHLVQLDLTQPEVCQAAEGIYGQLQGRGVEVLYDERNESPGRKFKDADLIGFPYRVTVASRNLKEGRVEIKPRSGKEILRIEKENVLPTILKMMDEDRAATKTKIAGMGG